MTKLYKCWKSNFNKSNECFLEFFATAVFTFLEKGCCSECPNIELKKIQVIQSIGQDIESLQQRVSTWGTRAALGG